MSTPTSAPLSDPSSEPAAAPSADPTPVSASASAVSLATAQRPRVATPVNDDVRRDVYAVLAGREELGPAYDEHFADNLVERLNVQIQREVERQLRKSQRRGVGESRHLTSSQRLGLAIPSLVFLIPLVAIGGQIGGLTGMIVACAAVIAINIAAGLF